MSGKFHFVNGLRQDGPSRKLARRHVMMGRNAGRRLNRPSRRAPQQSRSIMREMQNSTVEFYVLETSPADPGSRKGAAYWVYVNDKVIARSLGDRVHTFSLPVEIPYWALNVLNEFFTGVVERLYPVQLGLSLHDMKFLWVQTMCMDSDAFKGCIALMSACNDLFLDSGKTSSLSLRHLSDTIQIVNRRLSGELALSNSTIAIVLSLVQQEQMRNEFHTARIHAQGLGRLVQLRGGIETIESGGLQNKLLVMKLCKTDLVFALQYGQPLMFYRDGMAEVRKAVSAQGLQLDRAPLPSPSTVQQLDPCLEQTLQDVMGLCLLYNNGLQNRTLDIITHLDATTSLLYRLLRFRSVGSCAPISDTDSAHHISLVLFVAMLILQRGSQQILLCQMLNRRARQIIERDLGNCSDEFAFWIMVTTGIWIGGVDFDWLVPFIQATATRLGLKSWYQASACLAQFPWIHALFNAPGLDIWNKTQYRQESDQEQSLIGR